MPSKIDKLKLSETQDRRIKLTITDKEEIVKLYNTGEYSLRMLAEKYNVSKKLILITVNPITREKSENHIRNNWKKYQLDKEKRNEYARKTREYKRELYNKGELK